MGDLVEVAWKGKFRLESLDIYQGLAWYVNMRTYIRVYIQGVGALPCASDQSNNQQPNRWSAVVVDKRQDGSRYKIHYPGWYVRTRLCFCVSVAFKKVLFVCARVCIVIYRMALLRCVTARPHPSTAHLLTEPNPMCHV